MNAARSLSLSLSLSLWAALRMSGQLHSEAEWFLDDDGSWRPCDRKEPVSALHRQLRERLRLNARQIAASIALCKRVRQRLRAQRAWHAAMSTTVN